MPRDAYAHDPRFRRMDVHIGESGGGFALQTEV